MIVPGLHSIYGSLSLAVCKDNSPADSLGFRVTAANPRHRLVRMDICGGGISGTVEALLRHPPVAQASMATIEPLVSPKEFAGATALIVGGSRGLGNLTAKLIAAGGGNVIATYAAGKMEAEELAAEITAWGGRCQIIHYDVRDDAALQLSALSETPTHIYYFATPPISRERSGVYSSGRFDEFNAFYISGFHRLMEASLRSRPDGISAFYPSSVFVESRPDGMTEYAMSKAAGEILCADLNAQMPKVRITMSRLPRLLTDQTAALPQSATLDAPTVMLPIIRKVQLSSKN
jgi:hypothetical protein